MSLPLQLRRRIEGTFDPVAVFRELVDVPCVTFSEYLVYQYLATEFNELARSVKNAQQEKLSLGYSRAGQLLVRWRGLPSDRRRTVLVAHVDREGFIVRDLDRGAGRALCWHTAGTPPESHMEGQRVRLRCGDELLTGRIARIDKVEDRPGPFDHDVEIAIDETTVSGVPVARTEQFLGIGEYDIASWKHEDGVIAATNVDNTAGVSVLVALLNAIVRGHWSVNVDCLFTTCEEAGFCGVVAELLESESVFHRSDKEEIVCIVVDSSSQMKFLPDSRAPGDGAAADTGEPSQIPLYEPVVRTGDSRSLFDLEVAQMLCAAARNIEGDPGDRDWISSKYSPGLSHEFRQGLKATSPVLPSRQILEAGRARFGRMVGGWCEATPLIVANAIRERSGSPLPSLELRVGAVGIPVASYRNSFRQELQPEKCHENALRGACRLLGEAVRLCHRWPFGVAGDDARARIPELEVYERTLQQLVDWQRSFAGLSSVTRAWTGARTPTT